jgi:hypothetical protein
MNFKFNSKLKLQNSKLNHRIKRYLKMRMDAKEKREGTAIQTMDFRQ